MRCHLIESDTYTVFDSVAFVVFVIVINAVIRSCGGSGGGSGQVGANPQAALVPLHRAGAGANPLGAAVPGDADDADGVGVGVGDVAEDDGVDFGLGVFR